MIEKLKFECEGLLIVAENQSIPTRNHQNPAMRRNTSNNRISEDGKETIDHVVFGILKRELFLLLLLMFLV